MTPPSWTEVARGDERSVAVAHVSKAKADEALAEFRSSNACVRSSMATGEPNDLLTLMLVRSATRR